LSELVDLTKALVRLDTINPPGQEAEAAELVAGRLEAAGLEVERYELGAGRPSLVARLEGGGDRPPLCMTGHLDTVPLGRAEWSRDPFAGETDGDRLYGRGTTDMKGGLAAIVVAAERLAGLGRGAGGLELVLCAGEETGCEGALHVAGLDGALGRAGAVLVAEPTLNYPCVAHKGVVWMTARTSGRSSHGSMPELGDNAVYKLARAIGRLEGFRFDHPTDDLLGDPTLSVGTIEGGVKVNVVPDFACATVDVRTVPGLDDDGVLTALRAETGDEVELEPWVALPPVVTDPAEGWVAEVFDLMEPLVGERPEPRGLAYFTDASALTPAYGGVPTIVCGPGDPGQAHQTDEHCSLELLEVAAEGFFEIGRRWCRL